MFGFRKLFQLLGRSEERGYDCERAQLFPLVPSSTMTEPSRGWPTIINKIFRGLLLRPAKPPLYIVSHDGSGGSPARTSKDTRKHTPFQFSDITTIEIAPVAIDPAPATHVDLQELGTITPPSSERNECLVVAPLESDNKGGSDSCVEDKTHTPIKSANLSDSCAGFDDLSPVELSDNDNTTVGKATNHLNDEPLSCWNSDHELTKAVDQGGHDEDLFDEEPKATSSDSLSVSSEEDEWDNLVDPEVLRSDWAPLLAIPEHRFRLALLEQLPRGHDFNTDDVRCVDMIQGGNNLVRILEIAVCEDDDFYGGRWIIKVPCTGTAQRWQDSDAYMLRNDAQTMWYIRENTDIPCPEMIAFSDKLGNVLGAPFIIMRANDGIPANKIWFDQTDDDEDDLDYAHLVDEDRMKIRVNFLCSLARHMAELRALEFDRAGTLNFDEDPEDPIIGPTYHWKTVSDLVKLTTDDMATPASINCIPSYATSFEYFQAALDKQWPRDENTRLHVNNGRRNIMCAMLASAPFNKSIKVGDNKETFVLRHDDLDFQNILCDPKTGEVTGIIDWDKCRAAPRCIGFASLPAFLTQDWAPEFSTFAHPHMPWELDEYRNVYTRAMLEATGSEGDGKFTLKSAIYEAANAALYGGHSGGSVPNFVHLVLKELKATRKFDDLDILTALGRGDWTQGEWMVRRDVSSLVAPQSKIEPVEPTVHPY